MTNRSLAILAIGIVALAGADLYQALSIIAAFLFTNQLPADPWFKAAIWLWFPLALLAAWSGLYGAYRAIRTNSPDNAYLTTFLVFFCIVTKISGYVLGFSSLRLGITLGHGSVQLGANLVGFALLAWLAELRRRAPRSEQASTSTIGTTEEGAA